MDKPWVGTVEMTDIDGLWFNMIGFEANMERHIMCTRTHNTDRNAALENPRVGAAAGGEAEAARKGHRVRLIGAERNFKARDDGVADGDKGGAGLGKAEQTRDIRLEVAEGRVGRRGVGREVATQGAGPAAGTRGTIGPRVGGA